MTVKKLIKFISIVVIILVGIGYGIYYFGTNVAANKVMDVVSSELENSGQLEELKEFIQNDPELQSFIAEGANIDASDLPFKTKEEATRAVINKVGIGGIQDIYSQYQEGTISKEEIFNTIQNELTEEEILALKVIAYKELIQ